nr:hypothetical protein [Tanacetum cinerariifolium]
MTDNSIPSGIENFANDSEGDIYFLEELLIDDSILSHESSNSNSEDNPSIPRPPSEPPDVKTDAGEEIPVSGVEELVPILSENEVTLEDQRECDVPISENSPIFDDHSDIFSDFKIDDDISVYDDDFEDIEYVEASLPDPEIVSVEEENDINQEEEEIDFEDISQIQDVVLREKLLSISRLISNIESLNDNPIPDCVVNSFESDNSLSDNFSPEFETFCNHTRSGNTTHADNSLL